ncbi:MAG: hypothetical protein JWN04_6296 [Myxococcaceae bacterium]|nr:hypothetical protein [Myxococcaceae bacterium]
MAAEESAVTRPKKVRVEAEMITVWPSSYPDEVGSIAPADSSVDSDELGSHFMNDSVEHGHSRDVQWEEEAEEPYFDERMGDALLRSFGLKPMPKRTTTRPLPFGGKPLPKLAAPRMPQDFDEFFTPSNDVDLTDETIRDASLMDHEGEEAGEVESPNVNTEDVHTHNKRRGGHVRTSLRPPKRT